MTPLPPEIDDKMWRLAEAGKEAERAEFVFTHPQFCDELARRISLLTRFKESRTTPAPKGKFVPSAVVKPIAQPVPGWLFATVCFVVVCSLGFAGYAAVQYMAHRQGPTTEKNNPALVENPSQFQPRNATDFPPMHGAITPNTGSVQVNPQNNVSGPPVQPNSTAPEVNPNLPGRVIATRWDTPITVVSKHTDLDSVLLSIASQAHVSIHLAPRMPNPDIEIDFRRQAAKAVLDNLGSHFGFTVIVQTETTALAIPAIDPAAPAPTQVGSSGTVEGGVPKDRISVKNDPKMGAPSLPSPPNTATATPPTGNKG